MEKQRSTDKSLDVLLAVMPFGPIFQPSLGASILRESLASQELIAQIEYFSIEFVDVIGLELYEKISEYYPDSRRLFGEWIFSHSLFSGTLNRQSVTEYLELAKYRGSVHMETVSRLCATVGSSGSRIESYIENTANRILALRPKLLGFTTMFQQHTASLAVARRVKAAAPEIFIVFGGANVEGPMGLETLRSFPFVDAVVSGPGEIVLPLIAKSILQGQSLPNVSGVTYQTSQLDSCRPSIAPELPMDAGPIVLFEDFFDAYKASKTLAETGLAPSVLIETSRGCWWGQKHHCTFCGLNGAQMKFRMKSAERAGAELKGLARAYPQSRVVVTDNIMPQSYYRDLIPALKKSDFPAGLFLEIKSNVTEEQIEGLANAGVDLVQVGIENFSTPLLTHMKKGVSSIANVAFLKHCATHDIKPSWILLTGFPCETESDYLVNIKVAKLIRHLSPPQICTKIRIDRFSPNHADFRQFGFSSIRPIEAYSAIYRSDSIRLEELAYFFDGEAVPHKPLENMQAELDEVIDSWKACFPRSELWAIGVGDEDVVIDARGGPENIEIYHLDEKNSGVLRSCERKTGLRAVENGNVDREREARIAGLEKLGILFCENNAMISLPLRFGYSKNGLSTDLYHALISSGFVRAESNESKTLHIPFGREISVGTRHLERSRL